MIPRIILIILLYFLYRSVKSWYQSNFSKPGAQVKKKPGRDKEQIEGDMIQDPVCKVYFSKKEGVVLNDNGHTYIFCSEDCRDAFLSVKKKSKQGE